MQRWYRYIPACSYLRWVWLSDWTWSATQCLPVQQNQNGTSWRQILAPARWSHSRPGRTLLYQCRFFVPYHSMAALWPLPWHCLENCSSQRYSIQYPQLTSQIKTEASLDSSPIDLQQMFHCWSWSHWRLYLDCYCSNGQDRVLVRSDIIVEVCYRSLQLPESQIYVWSC